MAKLSKTLDEIVGINRLETRRVVLYLLGTTPLICNRMPKKAREQLLLPPRQTNRAARDAVQKHNPPFEFRDSVYQCRDEDAPTLLHLPRGSFKKALAQAALDTPGATKAEIGRLVSVISPTVYLYGVPRLYMTIVRQLGINRTPDIRTRAILPEWACEVELRYVAGKIREQDIANLSGNAGMICGVGDGRTEKGAFDFGSWDVVERSDDRFAEIVKRQGREAQVEALAKPQAYDADSEELLAWYEVEIVKREADRGKAKTPADAVLASEATRGKRAAKRNGELHG